MKRYFTLILALLLLLTGCSRQTSTAESDGPTTFGNAVLYSETADHNTSAASGEAGVIGYIWNLSPFSLSQSIGMGTVLHGDEDGNFYLKNTVDGTGSMTVSVLKCEEAGTVLETTTLPIVVDQSTSLGDVGMVVSDDTVFFDYTVTLSSGGGDQPGEYGTYLAACDKGGNLLFAKTTEELGISPETYLTGMVLCQGNCLLATEQDVLSLDLDGNVAWRATANRTIGGICLGSDGKVYLQTVFDGDDLLLLNTETHTVGEIVYTMDHSFYAAKTGVLGYDLLLEDNQGETPYIYGLDLESGSLTPLFDVGALGMYAIGPLIETSQGTLLCDYISLLLGRALGQLVQQPITGDRSTITLGVCGNLSSTAQSAVSMFNATYPDYYLSVLHYNSPEDLNLAVISGEGPDILCFSGLSEEDYLSGSKLVDLYSLMSGEAKENLHPKYRQEYEKGGSLFRLCPTFCLETLMGNSECLTGTETTFEAFDTAAENLSTGGTVWDIPDSSMLLGILLPDVIQNFVDFENGTCQFDTPEFEALLQLCSKAAPGEEGEQPLFSIYYDSLLDYTINGFPNRTYLGFPAAGVLTTPPEDTFGILAASEHPSAAWCFLELLLTEDIQKAYSALTGTYPVVSKIYQETVPDELQQLVSAAQGHRVDNSPVYDIILEEAEAFFSGDQSAGVIAQRVQSRVSIYLGESR